MNTEGNYTPHGHHTHRRRYSAQAVSGQLSPLFPALLLSQGGHELVNVYSDLQPPMAECVH